MHEDDRGLLAGELNISDLVTIRKDELVYSPLSGRLEPAKKEFLKIGGQGSSWTCKFYDQARSSCTIHARRPLECRALKCWDTGDIEKIIYKNLINRFDLLAPEEKIIPYLKEHEDKCPWYEVQAILQSGTFSELNSGQRIKLDGLIRTDLAIRTRAIDLFSLTLDQELFYFGRPIFQIIEAMRKNALI